MVLRRFLRPLTPVQLTIDIVIAALIALMSSPLAVAYVDASGTVSVSAIIGGILTILLLSTAAALRRLSPPLALATAWVGAIVQMSFARIPSFEDVAILLVLFATAAYGSRRLMWWGLASAGAGAVIATAYILFAISVSGSVQTTGTDRAVGLVLIGTFALIAAICSLGLSWASGLIVRMRLRNRDVEKERAVAEALAVAEMERARIARDMHDVVAHSLAVVIAQADGARYMAAADPDAAASALKTIGTTARSALSDVRLLLTQLRHSEAAGPQPTISDLDDLWSQVRAAGVDLHVEVEPRPRTEPPAAVQLAVYRILQEAITNAMRHGAGREVAVYLAWHADRVDLGVHNPLAATATTRTGGHGLIGMRERAQLVGGRLDAGREGDRFVVRATIPIAQELT